jgi:predicted acyltransferase
MDDSDQQNSRSTARTQKQEPAGESRDKKTKRLVSLDAYRGLIMISLISGGFGLSALAGHRFLNFLAEQSRHVKWEGLVYWDLIQPAFIFMVGVAMPFSYAKRRFLGDSHQKVFAHVVQRSILLIVISNILGNLHREELTIGFINVLSQIGIAYFLSFFVLNSSYLVQGLTAGGIMLFYTLAWIYYPGNGPGGPWEIGWANMGGDFDRWLLGKNYVNHYVGLNALNSTATIIFGQMCGKLVGSKLPPMRIVKILAAAGVGGIVSGLLLSPVVPIVKRIWTASFTLYSGGFVILGLLFFYWIVEVKGYRRWTFFLVVVGMNSIAAYTLPRFFGSEAANTIQNFLGPLLQPLGPYGSVAKALLVLAIFWYILYFCYKRKIFFKV